jgi:arylsulfatase A-like enzyme
MICWVGGVRAAPQKQPNVILIYTDDVGFGDVGAYGSKLIPTPNIDRLAQSGLRFTDAHSTASTCTPSRFSILTGIYAFRYGAHVLPPGAPLIIPLDRITLPKE